MQGRQYIPCTSAEYYQLDVTLLPPQDLSWSLCDMPSLLRGGHYQVLDEQLDVALDASLLSREAEQRYYLGWMNTNNTPDLYDVISTGTKGLAQIKAWQQARPASSHAWLAEVLYWNHYAWQYRSHGWARETTPAMWVCAGASNEMMVLAAVRALALEPRQWMVPALAISVITVFHTPYWFTALINGEQTTPQPLLTTLRDSYQDSPEEFSALMAHSGLDIATLVMAPESLPACLLRNDGHGVPGGAKYWLYTSLQIHPRQFYIFAEYIPFQMPRWRGSHEQMRQLIDSPRCKHLSEQERDHLRHLIFWDDFRDELADSVTDPLERERQLVAVKRQAEQALNADDRAEALRWLTASYSALGDDPNAWHYMQLVVTQNPSLSGYLQNTAQRLAEKYAPASRWRRNQICHNVQYGHSPKAMVLQGYCLLTGLFGFTQDETLGRQCLDYAITLDLNDAWDDTARLLVELGYLEDALRLLTLGVEYGAHGTLSSLASRYLYAQSVPQDIPRAMGYCRQIIEHHSALLSQKKPQPYPLIENNKIFSYQDELQSAYNWLARGYQLLLSQATGATEIAELEEQMIGALKSAVDVGSEQALPLLLAILSELNTLSVTHQYLELLLEYGNKGSVPAMISLAKIYSNRQDKQFYNYKLSARWIYFAQALAPDDEKVNEVLFSRIARNRWTTFRYVWSTLGIKEHDIPGQENGTI